MKLRKAGMVVAVAAVLTMPAASVHADTITFPDQGSWTLENLGLVADLYTADNTNDTYRIRLTYDSLGYTGGATDYIQGVAVKVSSNLDAGAGGGTTAPGTWTFSVNTLNNNGCDGGTNAGFGCYEDGNSAVTGGPATGTSYTWDFLLDISGDLFTDPLEASIKALFKNSDGTNAGLLSENITLQEPNGGGGQGGGGGGQGGGAPEPATLALFGLAAVGAAHRARRRMTE